MKHHFFVSEIPGYDAVFYFRRKVAAENGQDVYSSYREYIRLHENTSCQGKPRHPKRAKWRIIAMTKNKRSGSEVRQRTKVITLRVNNRIANEIRRRAKSEGLTISEYIRTTSLNNEIKQRVPSRYLDELIQLGRMQKKLFDKGKRPKDKEYLDVMHKIISLCAEMKEVTQRISDIYKKMDLIKEEIKA
ncbi:plasmid mobilization protein MobA, partial [Escherichia fergusonii]